jgi:hypothetical protein
MPVVAVTAQQAIEKAGDVARRIAGVKALGRLVASGALATDIGAAGP